MMAVIVESFFFVLSIGGLAWCWITIHREAKRERERFTPEEIQRFDG